MMEPRLRASRTRKARRTGRCPLCSTQILVGQAIGLIEELHSWAHTACLLPRRITDLDPL